MDNKVKPSGWIKYDVDRGSIHFKKLTVDELDGVIFPVLLKNMLKESEFALPKETQLDLIRMRIDQDMGSAMSKAFNSLVSWMLENGRMAIDRDEFNKWYKTFSDGKPPKSRRALIEYNQRLAYKIITTAILPPTIVDGDVVTSESNPFRYAFINILRSYGESGEIDGAVEEIVDPDGKTLVQ